jgi:hypothetical protein
VLGAAVVQLIEVAHPAQAVAAAAVQVVELTTEPQILAVAAVVTQKGLADQVVLEL